MAATQYLTPSMITNEATMLLRNRIVGVNTFNKDSQVMFDGVPKPGRTVSVRRRGVGTVQSFGESDTVNVTMNTLSETNVDIKLERQSVIGIAIDDADLSLNISDFGKQVLLPQINELVQEIDSFVLTKFKEIPTVGGTGETAPGILPADVGDLALIDKTLNDQLVPLEERIHVISSLCNSGILSIPNLTRVNEAANVDTLRRASVGAVMNLDHAMTQGIDSTTFTSGTSTGCVVNGALAAGATSIVYDGASGTTVTLKKYDIITIAGYGNAVIAADDAAVSSAGTLTIFDPLRTAVADDVVITVYDGGGNTRQLHGAAFHPTAFEFVAVAGAPPMGGADGFTVQDGNLAMRTIFGWSSTGMVNNMTLDLYYGAKLVDPRLACQTVKNIP